MAQRYSGYYEEQQQMALQLPSRNVGGGSNGHLYDTDDQARASRKPQVSTGYYNKYPEFDQWSTNPLNTMVSTNPTSFYQRRAGGDMVLKDQMRRKSGEEFATKLQDEAIIKARTLANKIAAASTSRPDDDNNPHNPRGVKELVQRVGNWGRSSNRNSKLIIDNYNNDGQQDQYYGAGGNYRSDDHIGYGRPSDRLYGAHGGRNKTAADDGYYLARARIPDAAAGTRSGMAAFL